MERKVGETIRGFSKVEFDDSNQQRCSIQCSSAIDTNSIDGWDRPGSTLLWLGINNANPIMMESDAKKLGYDLPSEDGWCEFPIPSSVILHTRMHLNRAQVEMLVSDLQSWLDCGSFKQ